MRSKPKISVRMERSWLVVCFKADDAYKAKVAPVFGDENLITKLRDPRIVGAHVFDKRETAERYAAELCQAYRNADQ